MTFLGKRLHLCETGKLHEFFHRSSLFTSANKISNPSGKRRGQSPYVQRRVGYPQKADPTSRRKKKNKYNDQKQFETMGENDQFNTP